MNIFITLDYELFLGRETGSVNNCLVLPTTDLMDILSETGTKVSFMVDGAYLCRLAELKASYNEVEIDYQSVRDNLIEINRRGHNIQYHFHPQWLYSQYEAGKGWLLDYDHYKLSDVPKETLKVKFKKGIELINEITGTHPCAFRAGGFTLCSFDVFGELFKENGIKLDTSVLVGDSINSKFQVYDYKSAPNKSMYFFRDDVCEEVENSATDKFIEMPLSYSDPMMSFLYMIKKRKMTSDLYPFRKYGDGVGVSSKLTFIQRYKEQLGKFFGKMRFGGSIDGFLSSALWKVYEDCKNHGYKNMVILGHPKLTTDKSLTNVKNFIDDMIKLGNEFHTLDEVVNNNKLQYGE